MEITSGWCVLTIIGCPDLNLEEINSKLSITPTRMMRRGEINNIVDEPVKKDIWTYKVKITEEPNSSLNELLKILMSKIDFITEISSFADVYVRCYIQSDLAQIGFNFSPDTIKMLAKLNIRFEISILSWGKVEME